jgi:beta-glucosidase
VTRAMPAFPADFLWGAATASYQIEGAVCEDGRSESIWDRFSATPGKVRNGESGAIACDFYHRHCEDITLMRELGLQAFRFSLAWPRILPDGTGKVNELGLDFYDRLVDDVLNAGIEPFVTLYHWDLPQILEDRGGWPSRDLVAAFVEYTDVVTRRLGDRVRFWTTHNEPWCTAWLGYGTGLHAPGRTSTRDALAAAHHTMLSHGRAVEVIRRNASGAKVGITLNLVPIYPASDDEADVQAAAVVDTHSNLWFLDPIFRGMYPDKLVERFRDVMPCIEIGDMNDISTPIDFLGINNYSRSLVAMNVDGTSPRNVRVDGHRYTEMGWEVYPDGLLDLLLRVHRDYSPASVYITENGAAFSDIVDHQSLVLDPERREYFQEYISAAGTALEAGVPLAGYFAWSLLDNFEWQEGYSKRFGLVYVDYPSQKRIVKDSGRWYRSFIRQQTAVPI